MNELDIIKRTSYDLYIEQLKWSAWFIGVLIILHVAGSLCSLRFDFGLNDMFGFSYISTPIYMLVIGIIAGSYYLPFYVKHGVPRRDYFIGSSIASFMLSITLAVIFKLLAYLEGGIYALFNLPINYIAIGTASADSSGILMLLIYSINLMLYYTIGWMIYTGFYRFKWVIGLGFVALSIAVTTIHGNLLWPINSNNVSFQFYKDTAESNGSLTILLSYPILTTVALIALLLVIIRLNTKKIPIKI